MEERDRLNAMQVSQKEEEEDIQDLLDENADMFGEETDTMSVGSYNKDMSFEQNQFGGNINGQNSFSPLHDQKYGNMNGYEI